MVQFHGIDVGSKPCTPSRIRGQSQVLFHNFKFFVVSRPGFAGCCRQCRSSDIVQQRAHPNPLNFVGPSPSPPVALES